MILLISKTKTYSLTRLTTNSHPKTADATTNVLENIYHTGIVTVNGVNLPKANA